MELLMEPIYKIKAQEYGTQRMKGLATAVSLKYMYLQDLFGRIIINECWIAFWVKLNESYCAYYFFGHPIMAYLLTEPCPLSSKIPKTTNQPNDQTSFMDGPLNLKYWCYIFENYAFDQIDSCKVGMKLVLFIYSFMERVLCKIDMNLLSVL